MKRAIKLVTVSWLCLMASCVFSDILERPEAGKWFLADTTGYGHGCTLPRSGKEHKKPQRTASGKHAVPNWHIAADRRYYAYGTVILFSFDGIVTSRVVEDTGYSIKGPARFDLFMADCGRANTWGVRKVWVKVHRRPLGGMK